MAKGRSSGGIGGSGIFGGVGVGGVVQCPSSDTSMYCQFMKFMSVLMNIILLLSIIYLAYIYLGPFLSKGFKSVKRGVGA